MKNRIMEELENKYSKIDKGHVIKQIMEIDKEKKEYKEITDKNKANKWINDRFIELNEMDKQDLDELLIKSKIPKLESLKVEDIELINKLLDMYHDIHEFKFKSDRNINAHVFAEHLISELKSQNISIDNISEELIDQIHCELNSTLSKILNCVIKIHQFYNEKLKTKYAVVCNVSGGSKDREFNCQKGKIISGSDLEVLEEYRAADEFTRVRGMAFDQEHMEYLFSLNLYDYIDWNEVTKKAFEDVKRKFPDGTIVLLSE